MPEPQAKPTDEEILTDPSAHTVEQVTDAFSRAPVSRIEAAQEREADGKKRAGILDFEPPKVSDIQPSGEVDPSVDRYNADGWAERARWFTVDGRAVSRHAVAGALAGAGPDDGFTQAEVQTRLERYLSTELKP